MAINYKLYGCSQTGKPPSSEVKQGVVYEAKQGRMKNKTTCCFAAMVPGLEGRDLAEANKMLLKYQRL